MALEAGKLYIFKHTNNGGGYNRHEYAESLVMIVTFEKVKPIYTKFNIFWLEENRSEKMIIDKFNLESFEARFVEVTDEKQIEESRKKVRK